MVSNGRRRQIKYRGPPKCAVQEYREPSQELAGLTQERLSRKNRQEAKRMARVVAREKKAEKEKFPDGLCSEFRWFPDVPNSLMGCVP